MIQIKDLIKQYKNKFALYNVNLHIQAGEFVFLVGASGAGKSTLMKMLYMEERPTRGQVLVGGINVANLPAAKIPNLRRIGITAFSDIEKCAEQIGGDYVSSWRPSPARTVCVSFDEDNVRKILRDGIDIMRRNNCVFDITLKDIHTIGGDIGRLTRFVQIAREEINR